MSFDISEDTVEHLLSLQILIPSPYRNLSYLQRHPPPRGSDLLSPDNIVSLHNESYLQQPEQSKSHGGSLVWQALFASNVVRRALKQLDDKYSTTLLVADDEDDKDDHSNE